MLFAIHKMCQNILVDDGKIHGLAALQETMNTRPVTIWQLQTFHPTYPGSESVYSQDHTFVTFDFEDPYNYMLQRYAMLCAILPADWQRLGEEHMSQNDLVRPNLATIRYIMEYSIFNRETGAAEMNLECLGRSDEDMDDVGVSCDETSMPTLSS
jgi:hypothetical protein